MRTSEASPEEFAGPSRQQSDRRVARRETLIVGFASDAAEIAALLPAGLDRGEDGTVLLEFAARPDPGGRGSRIEFNALIPARHKGKRVLYHAIGCNDDERPLVAKPAWAAGARARLVFVHDTVTGVLEFAGRPLIVVSMNCRPPDYLRRQRAFLPLAAEDVRQRLQAPRVAASSLSAVLGAVSTAGLIAQSWSGIRVRGAWTGPATVDILSPHVGVLGRLPVRAVQAGLHCVIDVDRAPVHSLSECGAKDSGPNRANLWIDEPVSAAAAVGALQ